MAGLADFFRVVSLLLGFFAQAVALAVVLSDFTLDLRRCLFVFSLAGCSFAFPDAIGLQVVLATPPGEQQGVTDLTGICAYCVAAVREKTVNSTREDRRFRSLLAQGLAPSTHV